MFLRLTIILIILNLIGCAAYRRTCYGNVPADTARWAKAIADQCVQRNGGALLTFDQYARHVAYSQAEKGYEIVVLYHLIALGDWRDHPPISYAVFISVPDGRSKMLGLNRMDVVSAYPLGTSPVCTECGKATK